MSTEDPAAWHPALGAYVEYQGERYQVVYEHRIGHAAPTYDLYSLDGHWCHRVPANQLRPAAPPKSPTSSPPPRASGGIPPHGNDS